MFKALFVCQHNAARSQMAEAYLDHLGKGKFSAESAGLEPGELNPVVVEVMREDGIDISQKQTNSVFQLFQEERRYDIVVTVCSTEASERCPLFPGKTLRLHWPFDDPSQIRGTTEETLTGTRKIRDEIKHKIADFVADFEKKGLKLFIEESNT